VARELGQLTLEDPAAAVEVDAGDLVVVGAAADRQPEHEATVREVVDRRRLLGEQRRVGAQRGDQDVGRQADALGHRGGSRQRDQRLVVGEDDAVDRAERGEPGALGAGRPLDYPGPVDAAHRVGKPDPTSMDGAL
jgi:hypothetical protein